VEEEGAVSIIAAMTEVIGNDETDSVGLAKVDEVLQMWRPPVRLEVSHIRWGSSIQDLKINGKRSI
jgi:hypothetical protein